jgi:hypothetical protein
MGTCHGGSGTAFNLPDFNGQFLRGRSFAGETRISDPDAEWRVAAKDGGNTGFMVGSAQPWSTGPPQNAFSLQRPVVWPTDGYHCSQGAPWTAAVYNEYTATIQVDGGDEETRPDNVAVLYYIKAKA